VTNISNGLFIVVIVDPVEGERIVETLIEANLILVDCHCAFAVLARKYPLKLAVGVKLIQYNCPLEEGGRNSPKKNRKSLPRPHA